MRLVARRVELSACPPRLEPYLRQSFITQGKEYDVHAVALFEGDLMVLVIDDLEYTSWRPVWLFDMCDSSIPVDWICNMFHDEPAMVLGPEFIAKGIDTYSQMVEHDAAQVQRFWERIDALRRAEEQKSGRGEQ